MNYEDYEEVLEKLSELRISLRKLEIMNDDDIICENLETISSLLKDCEKQARRKIFEKSCEIY